MSAADRSRKHPPVKGVDPVVSATILLWLQGEGSAEKSALPWQAHPEDDFRPEAVPDGSPDSEEVIAHLLRAIENTDFAARLQNVAPLDNGHPPADNPARPAESTQAASMLHQPPEPDADRLESTSGAAEEGNEAITDLLRAIQSTEVAATFEGVSKAEYAEHAGFVLAQPAKAETPTALPQAPEFDATVQLPTAAPETGELSAVLMHDIQSIEADVLGPAPTASEEKHPENASSGPIKSAESSSISKSPVARPEPPAFKQQNPQPKRFSRRRSTSQKRSDYLLSRASIVAPAVVPPPIAAAESQPGEPLAECIDPAVQEQPATAVVSEPAQAAEPMEPATVAELLPAVATTTIAEPKPPSTAEPLPVIATTVAEPEPQSIVEPAVIADGSRRPAATEDSAPKPPILARLGTGIGSIVAKGELINEGLDRAEMHLENWFQRWFGPIDPRHNTRVDEPPLVAYHWIVDAPQALKIANISAGGLHLITKDRWSEGNIVSMTLQRTDIEKGSPEGWIAVDFLVMRWCEDGMAGAFMPSSPGLVDTVAGRAANCADKKSLERFVNRIVDATAHRAAATK